MQKKLIVLAVAGLVSSGAFAAENNVTLYGIVDLGLVHDSGSINGSTATGSSTRLDSGVAQGSRIGLKGTEDLGNGLKTSFLAETGFCADNNTGGFYCSGGTAGPGVNGKTPNSGLVGGAFMSRQAWLNLSGSFGTISAGRQYTPGWGVTAGFDPFGAGTAGQINNLFNASLYRANNSVAYVTPSMSGFSAVYAHAFGEQVNNSKAVAGDTIGANYANGPLALGAAYLTVNDPAGNSGDFLKNTNLAASYNFGVAKLDAEYETTKSVYAGTDASNWMLGVTVPMGGGVGSHLAASYIDHNDKMAANMDATQVGVGYFYGLSKTTTLYTVYAHINNKNGAAFTVGNADANQAGVGDSSFNLGVTHAF